MNEGFSPAPCRERIAVVIVSHNGETDLEVCLEALFEASAVSELLVLDNASTDRSVEVAKRAGSGRANVIALAENSGFAGGCNRGLALLEDSAPFVAFMNPDVRVEPDCFTRCLETFDQNPMAGCVAPLLIRPDGVTVDSAGQGLKRWTLEVLDRGYGRSLNSGRPEPCRVLAACGAMAVFRREALEAVREEGGPWAESYFCFWEDLELGWRLNNAGWHILFAPSARAVHGRGAGAAAGRGPLRWRRPPHLEACILSNRWMTLIRHLNTLDLLCRAPVLLAWDSALVFLGILRRPALAGYLLRRLPLVRRELGRRRLRPRTRLKNLPC